MVETDTRRRMAVTAFAPQLLERHMPIRLANSTKLTEYGLPVSTNRPDSIKLLNLEHKPNDVRRREFGGAVIAEDLEGARMAWRAFGQTSVRDCGGASLPYDQLFVRRESVWKHKIHEG